MHDEVGDSVAIMLVRALPPKESRRTAVKQLFLYGMWLRPNPAAFSCSATITCSRYDSDKLMCFDSASSTPSEVPVFPMRSLPARSTMCSFDRRTMSVPVGRTSTYAVNTQWLRLLTALLLVSATARQVSPLNSSPSASSPESATCTVKFRNVQLPSSASSIVTRGK